jgi:hypothetical protein
VFDQQWWYISIEVFSLGGTNDVWHAFIEYFSPQVIQSAVSTMSTPGLAI